MSTQTIERTQASPLLVLRDRLVVRRDELAHALEGTGVSVDKFIRAAVTTAQIQPELVSDVSFQSLWVALLQACRDGLLPDGRQGAILPFKREAKWTPMYQGLLYRFQQSGEFHWVTADFHRLDDLAFDAFVDEEGQHFLHRPGPREGKIIETYAAAKTRSGAFFCTVVTESDMERIRAVSRTRREDAPWEKWPEEMKKKSALKRLCKLLPMSGPLEDLIQRDDAGDTATLPLSSPNDDRAQRGLPRVEATARPRGAQEALENFAMHGHTADDEGGAGVEISESDTEPKGQQELTPLQAETTAYERGQQARRDGLQRRAVPPEFRDPKRGREAAAWQRGWDGEALAAEIEHASQ